MRTVYLSDRDLAHRFSVSRSTIWRWAASRPGFPDPVRLSPGCSRWRLSEIELWEFEIADP